MKPVRSSFNSFLLVAFFASISHAQAQRTFVSGLGNDGNPCSRAAPCRTFTQAISQTNAGGEVVALDSAGYGPFSLSHSISVIAPPGIYAGISVFSGDGVDVSAGANDIVILRGLTINGQGGANGVAFSGGTLRVENCSINGMTNNGIRAAAPGLLVVKDTTISRSNNGIDLLGPAGQTLFASIENTELDSSTFAGLLVDGGVKAAIKSSSATGNAEGIFLITGFEVDAPSDLNIDNCLIVNNQQGVIVAKLHSAAGTARVSNSTVTGNSLVGLGLNSGVLLSRGNNTVEGNASDVSGGVGSYTTK